MFTENGCYGFSITEMVKDIEKSYNALNRTFFSRACSLLGINRKFSSEQLSMIRHQILRMSNDIVDLNPIKCNYEFYRELSPNLGYVNSYELNEVIHSLLHARLGKVVEVNKALKLKGVLEDRNKDTYLVNDNLRISFFLKRETIYQIYYEDTNQIFKKYLSICKKHKVNKSNLVNGSRIPEEFLTYLKSVITEIILYIDNPRMHYTDSDLEIEFKLYLRDLLLLPLYQINFRGYSNYCRLKEVKATNSLVNVVLVQDGNLK